MSQHGEAMKQLVAKSTGISTDEVVDMAPELLEELQTEKTEFGAGLLVAA